MQSKHFQSLLAYKSVSFRGGAGLLALIFRGGRERDRLPHGNSVQPPPLLNDDDNDDDEDDKMMMMMMMMMMILY